MNLAEAIGVNARIPCNTPNQPNQPDHYLKWFEFQIPGLVGSNMTFMKNV